MNLISKAIALSGGVTHLAKICGVSYQAVRRWELANRLPRTDLTGETDYARAIAKHLRNKITRLELIEATRRAWLDAA